MSDKITKQDLIDKFLYAKENNKSVGIEVTIPGQKDTEYIINKNESINNKLEYYKDTYNDKLEHIRNKEIKIVNVFVVDSEFLRKELVNNIVKERIK